MKKIAYLLLAVLLVLSFSSCADTENTETTLSTELSETVTEYKYTLTLYGRMPNAERDSVIVVRTNDESITFDYVAERILDSQYKGVLTPDFSIVSIETVE